MQDKHSVTNCCQETVLVLQACVKTTDDADNCALMYIYKRSFEKEFLLASSMTATSFKRNSQYASYGTEGNKRRKQNSNQCLVHLQLILR